MKTVDEWRSKSISGAPLASELEYVGVQGLGFRGFISPQGFPMIWNCNILGST